MAKKPGSDDRRARIVEGAGRGFRSRGYGGVGVDALAQASGLTSGAFYGHFESKAEAFRAVLIAGLESLREGIEIVRRESGDRWQERFTDFYLSERRTCDLAESCALQSLSIDAARADEDARAAYEAEWIRIRDAAAAGFTRAKSPEEQRELATGLLALLSGGVTIARAVRRPEVSEAIAKAVRHLALGIGSSPPSSPRRKDTTAGAQDERHAKGDAAERVRLAEDAWNSRDPTRVASAYAEDCWARERAEIARGRPELVRLLERKWRRELEPRTIAELFAADGRHIAARFVVEWRDDSGHWFRSRGVEQSYLDEDGLTTRREASINDVPIAEIDRLFRWPLGPRPVGHPGLTALGL